MSKIILRDVNTELEQDRLFVEACLIDGFKDCLIGWLPGDLRKNLDEELSYPYRIIEVRAVKGGLVPVGILMAGKVPGLETVMCSLDWPCYWVHRLELLSNKEKCYNHLIFPVMATIKKEAKELDLPIAAFVLDKEERSRNIWQKRLGLKFKRRDIAPFEYLITSLRVPDDVVRPLVKPATEGSLAATVIH